MTKSILCVIALLGISYSAFAQFGGLSFSRSASSKEANIETIIVEEPLTQDEIDRARRAAEAYAKKNPQVDADGNIVVPKVKTTRSVEVPKAEYYAPPPTVTNDERKLVHYFCGLWKECDYERMYYAMEEACRKKVSFKSFKSRFESDFGRTGGLKDEAIRAEEELRTKGTRLTLTLTFNYRSVSSRTVKAEVVKTNNGFRLADSSIIPAEL